MIGSQVWTLPLSGLCEIFPIIGKSMSCMYFHRPHRDQDDSTESSDSIAYWRKLLLSIYSCDSTLAGGDRRT
jgi:hypothetical protein